MEPSTRQTAWNRPASHGHVLVRIVLDWEINRYEGSMRSIGKCVHASARVEQSTPALGYSQMRTCYCGNWTVAKTVPCGSARTAMRPNGVSMPGITIVPPSAFALAV